MATITKNGKVMGRPTTGDVKRVKLNLNLDVKSKEIITNYAKAQNKPISRVIEDLIEQINQ